MRLPRLRNGMARMRRTRFIVLLWRLHPHVYRATRGLVGRRIGLGMPVLLLDTVGRKSGLPRTNAVGYLPDEGRYVMIASNQGHSAHPGWLQNLRANPEATIQVGHRKLNVHAREAEGEERERLWRKMTEVYPGFDLYAQRAPGRHIPVVVLEPSSPP